MWQYNQVLQQIRGDRRSENDAIYLSLGVGALLIGYADFYFIFPTEQDFSFRFGYFLPIWIFPTELNIFLCIFSFVRQLLFRGDIFSSPVLQTTEDRISNRVLTMGVNGWVPNRFM